MLESIVLKNIQKINEKKKINNDYYNLLLELEEESQNEKNHFYLIQAYTVLSEDFHVYGRNKESIEYSEKGISTFVKIKKDHILSKNDFLFTIECLCRIIIIRILNNGNLTIIDEFELDISYNSWALFKFLIGDKNSKTHMSLLENKNSINPKYKNISFLFEKSVHDKKIQMYRFLKSIRFIQNKEYFIIFRNYFPLYYDSKFQKSFITEMKKILNKIEEMIIILACIDISIIDRLISYILKQKNAFSELSEIYMTCLKINNLNIFKKIVIELMKLSNIFTKEEIINLRAIITSLIVEKHKNKMSDNFFDIKNFQKHELHIFIDWKQFFHFLYQKKCYSQINSFSEKGYHQIPRKILFESLIFLKEFEKAEKIYENELRERFEKYDNFDELQDKMQLTNNEKAINTKILDDQISVNNKSIHDHDKSLLTEIGPDQFEKTEQQQINRIPMLDSHNTIENKHLFLMYIELEKFSSAFNILDKITDLDSYLFCIDFIYHYHQQYIKQTIFIGLKKYRSHYQFLKIALSILHLENVDIQVNERVELILELFIDETNDQNSNKQNDQTLSYTVSSNNKIRKNNYKCSNFNHILQSDSSFFYNIIFNNILDLTDIKKKYKLLCILEFFELKDDTIQLFLYIFLEIQEKSYFQNNDNEDVINQLKLQIMQIEKKIKESDIICSEKTKILFFNFYKSQDKQKSDEFFNEIRLNKLDYEELIYLCKITDNNAITKIMKILHKKNQLSEYILNEIFQRFSIFGISELLALLEELHAQRINMSTDILKELLQNSYDLLKHVNVNLKNRIENILNWK